MTAIMGLIHEDFSFIIYIYFVFVFNIKLTPQQPQGNDEFAF